MIIPGIYRSGFNNNQTAFIMIFDGGNVNVFYERFEVEQFSCSTSSYDLHIGSNYFSSQKIILDIESEALTIKGQVTADNLNLGRQLYLNRAVWAGTLMCPLWNVFMAL